MTTTPELSGEACKRQQSLARLIKFAIEFGEVVLFDLCSTNRKAYSDQERRGEVEFMSSGVLGGKQFYLWRNTTSKLP